MAAGSISKRRKVFVVHGRSLRARDAMFEFLGALGLHPIGWAEAVRGTRKTTVHTSEIVTSGFAQAQAFVVLLTGDDEGRLRKRFRTKTDLEYERNATPQPRLNVVFEAGMAFGRHPQRTVFVQLGPEDAPVHRHRRHLRPAVRRLPEGPGAASRPARRRRLLDPRARTG